MKLNVLQKQELIKDYKSGMTWDGLCKKYKTNTNTIHKLFKKSNVQNTRIQDSS